MKSYDWPGLLDAIEHSGKQYNVEVIHDAYLVAEKAHDGQKRKSGEPYIIHPVAVAGILVEELGKVAVVVIAHPLGDGADGKPRLAQQLFRLQDALLLEVSPQSLARLLFEQAGQIIGV